MKAKTLAAMLLVGLMLGSVLVVMPEANGLSIKQRNFYFHGGDTQGSGYGMATIDGTADETVGTSEKTALVPAQTTDAMMIGELGYPVYFTMDQPLAEDLTILPGLKEVEWRGGKAMVSSNVGVVIYLQSVVAGVPEVGGVGQFSATVWEVKADGSEVPALQNPSQEYNHGTGVDAAGEVPHTLAFVGEEGTDTYTFTKGSKIKIGFNPDQFAANAEVTFWWDSEACASRLWFNTSGGGGVGGVVKMTVDSPEKNVHAGESATYTITLLNEGTATETGTLERYNPPTGWEATLNETAFELAAGASKDITLTVKAPADAKEGDKANITVTATYTSGASSVDTTTTVVGAGTRTYGAELSASPASGEADKGKQATYTITVKNKGSAQDTITLAAVSEKGWDVSLDKQSLTLAAGATGTAILTVKVPTTASEGDKDTATITATCGDGTTKVTKAVQTTVKAGAGSSGDGAKKGFIPGFEIIALIGGLGIAAIIAKSGNKKKW